MLLDRNWPSMRERTVGRKLPMRLGVGLGLGLRVRFGVRIRSKRRVKGYE